MSMVLKTSQHVSTGNTDAIKRFVSQLSDTDQLWLANQLAQAREPAPIDFFPWQICINDVSLDAGYVNQVRLASMMEALPGMEVRDSIAVWNTNSQNAAWRSATMQYWLWQLNLHGQMDDWRFEKQDWLQRLDPDEVSNQSNPTQIGFSIERCGFRHLGLRSRAVHINGFTEEGNLLVGQRAMTKKVDPGLFDNLAAGGILAAEDWGTTLTRELNEEAGLDSADYPDCTHAANIVICRREGENWHNEELIVYNLSLPNSTTPANQDGEVLNFKCMTAAEALDSMRSGMFTRDGIISLALGLG